MPFVVLAAAALAQTGYDAPTLEWMVARSDVVVRASVAEVSRELLPNDRAWIIVTLKVHEILKGRPPETLQYTSHSLASDRRYEGWKDAGRELLIFLLKNPTHKAGEKEIGARFPLVPYGLGWDLFRLGPAVPQEEGWSPPPSAVFRNTLDVVEDPAAIVEAARRAVAAGRGAAGAPREHGILLPRTLMQWSGGGGDANRLTLLVNPQLEILAREMIRSPAEVVSKRGRSTFKREGEVWLDGWWTGRLSVAKDDEERARIRAEREDGERLDRNWLRMEGVRALRYFKSEENIALLKPWLTDEKHLIEQPAEPICAYNIRQGAFEALREWGIPVPTDPKR